MLKECSKFDFSHPHAGERENEVKSGRKNTGLRTVPVTSQ